MIIEVHLNSMIRLITCLLLLIFGIKNATAQIIGEDYVAIPSDNKERFELKFLSYSTLEVKTKPRHMMPYIKSRIFSFINCDTSVLIRPNKIIRNDTLGLKVGNSSIFELFEKEIILSKIKDGFIDHNSKLIYVRRNIFDETPDLLFVVDGKEYSYYEKDFIINGKLYKQKEYNKILRRKLKKYNSNNCILKTLKGLNAYYKYGMSGVFGTFILTKKK
jgi:hypothetical protein